VGSPMTPWRFVIVGQPVTAGRPRTGVDVAQCVPLPVGPRAWVARTGTSLSMWCSLPLSRRDDGGGGAPVLPGCSVVAGEPVPPYCPRCPTAGEHGRVQIGRVLRLGAQVVLAPQWHNGTDAGLWRSKDRAQGLSQPYGTACPSRDPPSSDRCVRRSPPYLWRNLLVLPSVVNTNPHQC
jgi:hypothetical protein